MARPHGSAFTAVLLAVAVSAFGCAPLEPEIVRLRITVHELHGCPLPRNGAGALPASLTLTLRALGPFPASNRTAEVLPVGTEQQVLTFPPDTQGVEARADDESQSFLGYSDRVTQNGIEVLLWPEGRACDLFDVALAPRPDGVSGQSLGYSPRNGIALLAGGDADDDISANAVHFRTDTGEIFAVQGVDVGLREPRAYATITEFESRLLVAGGEDPFTRGEDRAPRRSAEVYAPSGRSFRAEPSIELAIARTRHAGVVLENGESLLVGGRTASGELTAQLEAVSPRTSTASISGLEALEVPRLHPSVLRLDDGLVFVGGGLDGDGDPVTALEWFSPDATRRARVTRQLPEARRSRSFVALAGGAVLAVGGCERSPEASEPCEPCGDGCRALDADAFWIAPDGEAIRVPLDVSPELPVLSPGSDGAPWLTFEENGGVRVLRFNPWCRTGEARVRTGCFESGSLDAGTLPSAPHATTSLGPDAFVWLDEPRGRLFGLRAGTRGPLSHDALPLVALFDPLEPERPLHLAPDRPDSPSRSSASFSNGELVLRPGTPSLAVHVTDTLYDDFDLTLEFSDEPPVVLVGALAVGDECRWPVGRELEAKIERRGSRVELVRGARKACSSIGTGSVRIALRAGSTSSTIRSLFVRRN